MVKVKLNYEQEPLIGFIGPVTRYNHNPNIDKDIYPSGTLNIVSDWQNFTFSMIPIDTVQISVSDIETLEILKNDIPIE